MVDTRSALQAEPSESVTAGAASASSVEDSKADTLHDLCLSCGLCCDGSLFEYVELEGEEREAFAGAKLVVVDDRPSVPLPCCRHEGRRCSIYARRPARCVAFTCQLYRNVEGQSVSSTDALERVREVHASLRRIEARLGWAPGTYSTTRFRKWAAEYAGGEAQARRDHPLALLEYGISRRLMERHFIPSSHTG
jgi:hypothetical protein